MQLKYKLILIGLLLALGLILHLQQGFFSAWYLYAAALLLMTSHLLLGSVGQAWQAMQRGNIDQASEWLVEVWQPQWLLPSQRTRYYLTQGLLALHRKEFDVGKHMLEQALAVSAGSSLDKAIALLNLAHIYMLKGDNSQADRLLEQAEAHAGNHEPVRHQIQKAKALLRSAN